MTVITADLSIRDENGVGLAILNRFTQTVIADDVDRALAIHVVEPLSRPPTHT
jgi:hypothetical protein